MDITIIIATLLVSLVSSIFSGIAGVGGGFIMAPYWLLIGLSPTQGAAVGSFMAIGMGSSSVVAFKNTGHNLLKHKRLLWTLMIVACVAAFVGVMLLPHIDAEFYKNIIALSTILALPLLFMRQSTKERSTSQKHLGVALVSLLVFLGSMIFNSAFSILQAGVLKSFFGLTVLQSTLIRRIITIIQSTVIFSMLATSGNFVLVYGLVGIIGGIAGSYIGTKFVLHKGELFAKYALAAGSVISSLVLILSS